MIARRIVSKKLGFFDVEGIDEEITIQVRIHLDELTRPIQIKLKDISLGSQLYVEGDIEVTDRGTKRFVCLTLEIVSLNTEALITQTSTTQFNGNSTVPLCKNFLLDKSCTESCSYRHYFVCEQEKIAKSWREKRHADALSEIDKDDPYLLEEKKPKLFRFQVSPLLSSLIIFLC